MSYISHKLYEYYSLVTNFNLYLVITKKSVKTTQTKKIFKRKFRHSSLGAGVIDIVCTVSYYGCGSSLTSRMM